MLSVGQIIDGFFAALVLLLAYRTFFVTNSGSEKRTERWHNELRSLATLLKELISEASAASTNLDRSLLKRKEELQTLLKQVESAHRSLPSTPATRPESATEEELPNESWSTRPIRGKAPSKPVDKKALYTNPWSSEEGEDSFELPEDRVSLSGRATERAEGTQSKKGTERALRSQIERSAGTRERRDGVREEQSAAYRVARRLLKQGSEIHVVARKVELPVAEVRALEAALRKEEESESREEETQKSAKETPRVVRRAGGGKRVGSTTASTLSASQVTSSRKSREIFEEGEEGREERPPTRTYNGISRERVTL